MPLAGRARGLPRPSRAVLDKAGRCRVRIPGERKYLSGTLIHFPFFTMR